ncbi:50S ribosomal protein L23 [Buchnera aphidicola]|uniref:50S ribosomal protein L23 n=1 Tax=Buchnera aphidicola TaxID=9 RepID=UPI00094C84C8|nr:50S ribosomal protein L23 [Buchnera aphidicola]
MILVHRLLKILLSPHVSEKASEKIQKNNTVVVKVLKNATKFEIKSAIEKFFQVRVNKVNTLIVKGKTQRNKNKTSKSGNWKKAYVILQSGQNLEFLGHSE